MTVIEIAKRAGVSIGTVDRVLHNRGRVSEDTRKRIQAIIDTEGYQPNPLARHLKRNKEYHIGVLLPELEKESRYWNLIYEGLLQAANELSAFSFTVEAFTFIRPDRNSLTVAFEKMVNADCTAWIIAPVMQDETLVLLMESEKKVPYIFIDSPLPGANPMTTVAQDPYRGGYLAGRLLELVSHSSGPFAVIRPYTEAFNLNERSRGFIEWFSARPDIKVLDIVCSEIDMDETRKLLDETMRTYPDLAGIFAVTAIGNKIADYVVSRGWKEKVAIIGYDLVAENIACLKSGEIDCLISQRPEEQGRHVMQQLYRALVLEESPVPQIDMPFDVFFKENLI